MKKTIITLIFSVIMNVCMAQSVTTYSVYDTNHSGTLTVSDVTEVVDKVKANVAVASTQQYVTAEQLQELFNAINSKLSEIDSKLSSLQSANTQITDKLGIPASVDLGLSVKWATCNIGATNPEDYGDYFAWGETTPYYTGDAQAENATWKTGKVLGYWWSSYSLCNGSDSNIKKYCTEDNKTTLEQTDDAACANWGRTWRMPTEEEFRELRTGCYWEWTSNYNNSGTAGYIVYKVKSYSDKGKKNNESSSSQTPTASYSLSDNHIFLPASGHRGSTSLFNVGTHGLYYSSSLVDTNSQEAWIEQFSSADVGRTNSFRSYGRSIRPVCK